MSPLPRAMAIVGWPHKHSVATDYSIFQNNYAIYNCGKSEEEQDWKVPLFLLRKTDNAPGDRFASRCVSVLAGAREDVFDCALAHFCPASSQPSTNLPPVSSPTFGKSYPTARKRLTTASISSTVPSFTDSRSR